MGRKTGFVHEIFCRLKVPSFFLYWCRSLDLFQHRMKDENMFKDSFTLRGHETFIFMTLKMKKTFQESR